MKKETTKKIKVIITIGITIIGGVILSSFLKSKTKVNDTPLFIPDENDSTEESTEFAHCGDCAYTGNKGMWKGTKSISGIVTPVEGVVELGSDRLWDLDDIITEEENNKIDGDVTGEAYCPICDSPNFY
jgi:hypothetical protein